MSYINASTGNPNGWRPGTLGEIKPVMRRLHRVPAKHVPMRKRRLGLGDDPTEADVTSQANVISNYFVQINTQLRQNENDAHALVVQTGQALPSDITQAIQQNRLDFESLLGKYNTAYAMAFGTTPSIPGLQGMGIDSSLLIGAMALLSPLAALVAVLWQNVQNTRDKIAVQKQQAQTQSTLANQLPGLQAQYNAAVAAGDATTKAQLQAQMAAITQSINSIGGGGGGGGNSSDFLGSISTFFAGLGTGGLIAVGVGAFLLLKK